jgi:lipoate-protein ligase A
MPMPFRLFRKAPPDRPLLFLFKNDPCVVIGRNQVSVQPLPPSTTRDLLRYAQNPWKEINFPALRALGVPFIRRRSGGGTVYHASVHPLHALLIKPHLWQRTWATQIFRYICLAQPSIDIIQQELFSALLSLSRSTQTSTSGMISALVASR